MPRKYTEAEIIAAFWSKVEKTDGCWNWTAAKFKAGYGSYQIRRRTWYAHRLSYELTYGAIPDGYVIDHICHNRLCVRPDHLRATTNKQNVEHRSGAQSNSKSGVLGVFWSSHAGKWQAKAQHHGRQYHGGLFDNIADAEAAATALRNRLFTHNDKDRLAAL